MFFVFFLEFLMTLEIDHFMTFHLFKSRCVLTHISQVASLLESTSQYFVLHFKSVPSFCFTIFFHCSFVYISNRTNK